jgi:hypothetical protein
VGVPVKQIHRMSRASVVRTAGVITAVLALTALLTGCSTPTPDKSEWPDIYRQRQELRDEFPSMLFGGGTARKDDRGPLLNWTQWDPYEHNWQAANPALHPHNDHPVWGCHCVSCVESSWRETKP